MVFFDRTRDSGLVCGDEFGVCSFRRHCTSHGNMKPNISLLLDVLVPAPSITSPACLRPRLSTVDAGERRCLCAECPPNITSIKHTCTSGNPVVRKLLCLRSSLSPPLCACYLHQMAFRRACCVATYDKINHLRIICSFSSSFTDLTASYF